MSARVGEMYGRVPRAATGTEDFKLYFEINRYEKSGLP
jgi:hypothetical protein